MNYYSIGQVSKIVNLPTKTIRFYEETGVITPAKRLANGYRSYPVSAVEELKLLKYVRDMGLPLSEVKKLMKGCSDGNCQHTEKYINSSIDNYLGILEGKIQQMVLLKSKLKELKKIVDKKSCKKNICCDFLHQIINNSKKGGGENG